MSEMKTFSGKNLDEAMEQACRHFKAEREKLEIEIITGGSTGIFGLVGKKKAEIRARLREEIRFPTQSPAAPEPGTAGGHRAKSTDTPPSDPVPSTVAPTAGTDEAQATPPEIPSGVEPAPAPDDVPPAEAGETTRQPGSDADLAPDAAQATVERPVEQRRKPRQAPSRPSAPRASAPERAPRETASERAPREPAPERAPRVPAPAPAELSEELAAIVREVMENLLRGILEEVPEMEISGNAERVTVLVLDEENSGLLIGREGQTLSSMQYLVNRIVARRHEEPVRVQINTGEYRERQDDNLRKMAVYLADKAKSLGRPQSTKPLSSYHRRVVHLALQEDETIQTRSKGDGPLKRVIIVPKAQRADNQAERAK
ncbi:RNA-binding cell elongation regulator Jag/EloR [Desulfolutivibrio sulfoxidireducens]|uniref:RNA-binding cell elongation regulator Jag/EloR n=1 Tax=Desulfolutivibrio sulfoxidireducens TaxID=2773299 RepID=UPI00159DBAE2|nr:RNA-binding cell elongation regulator Jag/EloR [Desulfolutivibrio sulfoxidireducens]QLA15741.1 KH domain-containing protein [Desulfolutivibrio sulfoxidireducens]